ncbi:hypothetical protein HMN09_00926100 [Mycena chlorophos]|uniref:Uncharacterized protein n=1 Tax=Mycena chlorophos TaxID=658473 RepID=A0A8H6SJC5_MYCCL|nr:hypothetical protein HMN09_00926100 [Mycena chlorophos]
MSGAAGEEAGAGVGGCCATVIYSIFQPFCNTKAWGSGGGTRVAGCCGSCFDKSFNEDSLDKWEEKKDGAETKQPQAKEGMSVPAAAPPATETEMKSAAS